ncbi:XrtA/PEP-CTERM system histidine kinase PrsK [Novosphingobium sp. 9]|uniref:XrtA/PEP-CTERM system histidine kinase PrsK n=1 Tax=Novosphingobium sp. 9 TaxID=2025349 RepID=UPI0021B6040F|nr:XrtA/PEP-CTERM system histidine kinase PrsK [Novosphingobium sp. 9]
MNVLLAASTWERIGIALDVTAASAMFAAVLCLLPRRDRLGAAGTPVVIALVLTAIWCLVDAALGSEGVDSTFPSVLESARNVGWFFAIYRMFLADGREENVAPVRLVILSLTFVEILHVILDIALATGLLEADVQALATGVELLFRLLATVGGLVLIHNLYVGAAVDARRILRWPVLGIAVVWAFELNLYTVAYLADRWPMELAAFRGAAALALAACVGVATARNADALRLRPSRAVAFQTFSLLVIGLYLIAMVIVGQWLSYAGGDMARLVELTFLTFASGLALVVLPSRRLRAWMRVMLVKHFFQHRYDYRDEWLRFARTVASDVAGARPIGERVIQAIADVFDCPAGVLLTPADSGDLAVAARFTWPDLEVPSVAWDALHVGYFEKSGFIIDLDDLRGDGSELWPQANDVPDWLLDDNRIWAAVPLIHFERIVGMVLLARPPMARRLDWEDFDLLRVMGQQAAAFLAENSSQEALADSARFDEFNRRIAFVMHDIKNLASQFSLLARNAELHAEKKAFRDDMLVTLRSSSEKLNALIARLSRYGTGGVERVEVMRAAPLVQAVADRFAGRHGVYVTSAADLAIVANGHSLEQVLVHLVQNAVDASSENAPICLSLIAEGLSARIDVVDSGSGMSAEFVRSRLFKPFVSTKSGGFGIGAFEARELVRAMHGRLDVESREGLGSRFTIHLPLATASLESGSAGAASDETHQKVA